MKGKIEILQGGQISVSYRNFVKLPQATKLCIFERQDNTVSQGKSTLKIYLASKNLSFSLPGSTHILTPKKLLDDIKMLNKSKDKVSIIKDE